MSGYKHVIEVPGKFFNSLYDALEKNYRVEISRDFDRITVKDMENARKNDNLRN